MTAWLRGNGALGPVLLLLLAMGSLGAGFQKVDEAAQREELIARLSANINKVDHSIEVTKELIKQSPDATYLPELYLRLAELYVERSRYVYARVMEQQPSGERTLSGEDALEVQISKRLAIETYDKILADFPSYEKNDQVRFFRAHEYRELGEWDTLLKQYQELIDAHPSSLWAVEARLILGDYYFDQDDIATAEKHYNGILALNESHLHDMARYKLGWIRINQERFKHALELFRAAVVSKRKKQTGAIGDALGLDVKREALLAMVWPFTESKKAAQAPAYFRELADSKTLYVEVLKRLANRYFVRTEYANAAELYREIVKLSSDIEEDVEFVQRIYDSVRNLAESNPHRWAHAADDVAAITATMGRFQNSWKFSDEEKAQLYRDFEIRARDLATRLHVDAKERTDAQAALKAAQAYREYLSVFGTSEHASTMRINRAEALALAGKPVDAGLEHEAVARGLENGPQRREQLYKAMHAFYAAIDEDARVRAKDPSQPGPLSRLELLRAREGLKQLGAFYVSNWPKDERVPEIKFNIARMVYQQGEYEESVELFKAFVDEYPAHRDARTAGELALDALHKLDDYAGLAKLAKYFVDHPKLKSTAFKNQAARLAENARRREVEFTILSTEGDFSQRMLDAWEKHKDSAEGEDVLYGAFTKFRNENNLEGVLDFGGRLLGAYPDSKRIAEVLGVMGNVLLRAADFEHAAFVFSQLSERRPDDAKATELLLSAGRINTLLGRYDAAMRQLKRVRGKGGTKERLEACELLFGAHDDAQDWDALAKAATWAKREYPNWMSAAFYLGLAHANRGDVQAAEQELSRAARLEPQSDLDRRLAGRAAVELGRLLHRRFDALVHRDAAAAETVVTEKMRLRDAIENAYVQATKSGAPTWVIAALHEAARLDHDFAEFVVTVPAPTGMGEADTRAFRAALAEQAKPFAERARQSLAACAAKAAELRVFTPYAAACTRGDFGPVSPEAGRRRGDVAGAAGGEQAVELRRKLAKQPESVAHLVELARLAVQGGDYHMARLVLTKAAETNTGDPSVYNLLGVALWSLGEPQEAFAAFERALRGNLAYAGVNLAALYRTYGYEEPARRVLERAGKLTDINATAPDVHPRARDLLGRGEVP